ncbi:hypothetical protein D3C87_2035030 [compost metagenome]
MRHRLLHDADLAHSRITEKAVYAGNQFTLGMGQKKCSRTLARNRQDTRLVAAAVRCIVTSRPGNFFRACAIGEIFAGNLIP